MTNVSNELGMVDLPLHWGGQNDLWTSLPALLFVENTEANFNSDCVGFVQARELQGFVKKAAGGRKSECLHSLVCVGFLAEGTQPALRPDCSKVWTQIS